MSKKFEFKKCKVCQWELHSLSGLKFMVNGQHHCSDCLEKKGGIQCRWCHKNLNPNRYSDGLGRVSFIFAGSIWGEEIDVSTVCCIDCLDQITKKRGVSNNGGWKNCEVSNCHFTVSPNEEATGSKKCYHCKQKEYNEKQDERNKKGNREFEKYKQAQQKAQSWWETLSSSEREWECERLVENMKQGKYWANNVKEGEGSGWADDGSLWMIENRKFTSRSPHLVPIQIVEEFMKKEKLEYYDEVKVIDFFESSMVKVKKDDSDNPPLKIEEGERIGKKLEIVDNNKSNNEVLVIDLKRISKITLRNNDKLEIEFSNNIQDNQNGSRYWYSVSQIVNDKQIGSNKELQAVKNYLQKTGKDSLNQEELNLLTGSNSVPTETPKEPNNFLKISGGILVVGLVIGFGLLIRKRSWKKHHE